MSFNSARRRTFPASSQNHFQLFRRAVSSFFAFLGANALEQDREVWENKIFRLKPLLVSGDGPFPAFIRWYQQFYSENSKDVGRQLFSGRWENHSTYGEQLAVSTCKPVGLEELASATCIIESAGCGVSTALWV